MYRVLVNWCFSSDMSCGQLSVILFRTAFCMVQYHVVSTLTALFDRFIRSRCSTSHKQHSASSCGFRVFFLPKISPGALQHSWNKFSVRDLSLHVTRSRQLCARPGVALSLFVLSIGCAQVYILTSIGCAVSSPHCMVLSVLALCPDLFKLFYAKFFFASCFWISPAIKCLYS